MESLIGYFPHLRLRVFAAGVCLIVAGCLALAERCAAQRLEDGAGPAAAADQNLDGAQSLDQSAAVADTQPLVADSGQGDSGHADSGQAESGSAASPVAVKLPNAPTGSSGIGGQQFKAATTLSAKDAPVMINGRPYVRPTEKEQFHDYLRDSYGWPALARTSARVAWAQYQGKPDEWGQDWAGFGQRFGSSSAVTVIDGNVRYGMEMAFKEDLRYIPCHGCSIHRKLENALLAEVTARHDSDGHRFFTLTPTITDMTGPIIANAYWVPGHTAIDGFVGSRLIFATRIGGHLFTEFVLERRHHDPKLPD